MGSKCAFLVKPFIPDRNNLYLSKNQSHLKFIGLLCEELTHWKRL